MKPIDPSLLAHITGGDPEPQPWIIALSTAPSPLLGTVFNNPWHDPDPQPWRKITSTGGHY